MSASVEGAPSCGSEPKVATTWWWRWLGWLSWPLIVALSLAGAIAVGAHTYLLVPVRYTAEASLLLSQRPDAISSLLALPAGDSGGSVVGMFGSSSAAQRLEQLVRSRALRRQLVATYDLARRYGTSERRAEAMLASAIGVRALGRSGALGGGAGMVITVTCAAGPRLNTWLGHKVSFTPAEAVQISAQMANDAVRFLDTYDTQNSISQARATREFVAKRKQAAEQDLAGTEQRLLLLQKQNRLLSPESQAAQLSEEAQILTRLCRQTEADIREGRESLQSVRAQLPAQAATRVEQTVMSRNPAIVKLEEELLDLQSDLDAALAAGALPTHPDVVALQDAIRAKRSRLTDLTAEVRQSVTRGADPVHDALTAKLVEQEVMLAGARGRQQIVRDQLARTEEQIADLPPIAQEYAHLSRQAQMQSDLVGTMTKRLEIAGIEEQRETSGTFQTLDEAESPLQKSGPSTTRTTLAAFLCLLIALTIGRAYRQGWISIDEREPPGDE